MKEEFIGRLQDREIFGIKERDVLGGSFSPEHGGKVASQGFGGVYSVGSFTIPVELQNGETRHFRFDQYQLGIVCSWWFGKVMMGLFIPQVEVGRRKNMAKRRTGFLLRGLGLEMELMLRYV